MADEVTSVATEAAAQAAPTQETAAQAAPQAAPQGDLPYAEYAKLGKDAQMDYLSGKLEEKAKTGIEPKLGLEKPDGAAEEAATEEIVPEAKEYELFGGKYKEEDIATWKEKADNEAKWRAENTQRAMDIAEQRKQLAPMLQFEQTLASDPDLDRKVQEVIKSHMEEKMADPEYQLKQRVASLEKRDLELKSKEKDLTMRQKAMELTNEAREVMQVAQKDYGIKLSAEDSNALLKVTIERGFPSVDAAFKSVYFDHIRTAILQKSEKAAQDKIRQTGAQTLRKPQGSGAAAGTAKPSRNHPIGASRQTVDFIMDKFGGDVVAASEYARQAREEG